MTSSIDPSHTRGGDERVPTARVLADHDPDWRVLLVGDVRMAPTELTAPYGAIDYYDANQTPGIEWLRRLAEHFRRIVWLNPLPRRFWGHTTTRMIGRLFPMFPLTIEGLEDAVAYLRR